MRYATAIRFLESLQSGAIHPGLERIHVILAACGRPERRYRTIHIAGTNGKGSTAAYLARMLQTAGFRTGLYTSPHLYSFRERIRVNGRPIPSKALAEAVTRRRRLLESSHSTYFEAATLLAFEYFASAQIDVAVVETGLGGRWDATTAVLPDCTVVTGIGVDHVTFLGRTLPAIASEKAGIFKSNVPVVMGPCPPAAAGVLRERAATMHAPLRETRAEVAIGTPVLDITGSRFHHADAWGTLRDIHVPLVGRHQLDNAVTALYTLRWLRARGWRISDTHLRRGIAATRWPGRLELVQSDPPVWLDVSHNPAGLRATAATLETLFPGGKLHVVLGMVQGKDLHGCLATLRPYTAAVYGISLATPTAYSGTAITEAARRLGLPASSCETVHHGLRRALAACRAGRAILLTGSHLVPQEYRIASSP